jgi:hypothetical protein
MSGDARSGASQNQQRQDTSDRDYTHRARREEAVAACLLDRRTQLALVRIDSALL